MVDFDVVAIHAEVIAGCLHVIQGDVTAVPQGLLGVSKVHVGQGDVVAAAELLGCLNGAVFDGDVARVPDARTRHGFKNGVGDLYVVAVPEWVLPLEDALVEFDVLAFLQR